MNGLSPRTRPRRVLLGVCGSIAACSTPEAVMIMQQIWNAECRIMATRSGATMVSPWALAALTGSVPLVDQELTSGVPHFDAVDWADLVLIMPATANVLAKSAHGIADDALTTAVLAADIPVIFVPAMNEVMWHRAAVQRNVAQLEADGYGVVPPQPALSLRTRTLTGYGIPPIPEVLDWIGSFLTDRGQPVTR